MRCPRKSAYMRVIMYLVMWPAAAKTLHEELQSTPASPAATAGLRRVITLIS